MSFRAPTAQKTTTMKKGVDHPRSLLFKDKRLPQYWKKRLVEAGKELEKADIPYVWFNDNSNSFIREVQERLGIKEPDPLLRWLPRYGNDPWGNRRYPTKRSKK
jgi:hypothetical protein